MNGTSATDRLRLSRIAFGCGANARLMVSDDDALRRRVVTAAVDGGIDLFDTAPAYGDGASERNLGRTLAAVGADVEVFTKVSLSVTDLGDIHGAVTRSIRASLARLGRDRVAGVTLHNRVGRARDVTRRIGPGPLLSTRDVLGPGGVVAALEDLRRDGIVDVLGFTTLGGEQAALDELLRSGRFDHVNAVHGILGELDPGIAPIEGPGGPYDPVEEAARHGLDVMALRVLGGGLLNDPGDRQRATVRGLRRWSEERGTTVPRVAIRHALTDPRVTTAVIGFSEPAHVEEALLALREGALDPDESAALLRLRQPEEEGRAC